jgi:electron transfer flavoprotein alpha/beta subunit
MKKSIELSPQAKKLLRKLLGHGADSGICVSRRIIPAANELESLKLARWRDDKKLEATQLAKDPRFL